MSHGTLYECVLLVDFMSSFVLFVDYLNSDILASLYNTASDLRVTGRFFWHLLGVRQNSPDWNIVICIKRKFGNFMVIGCCSQLIPFICKLSTRLSS